jgi:transcriptional regulator with XRE-family HTH domain
MATFSARELLEEEFARDPAFRAEWEHLALARQVAAIVLRYRADHDLTQTELARRLGVVQSAVARLESGEVNPSIDTLQRLSRALGLTIALEIQPPPPAASDAAGLVVSDRPRHELRLLADAPRPRPVARSSPPTTATARHAGGGTGRTAYGRAAGPAMAPKAARASVVSSKAHGGASDARRRGSTSSTGGTGRGGPVGKPSAKRPTGRK